MGTITAGGRESHRLSPGQTLTVSGTGVGVVQRFQPGSVSALPGNYDYTGGGVATLGPFMEATELVIDCSSGSIGVSRQSFPAREGGLTVAQAAAVAPGFRQVANRCYVATTKNATPKQMMARTTHIAFDNIRSIQVRYPNWSASSSAEAGSGAAATLAVGIEFNGAFVPLTFAGSPVGTAADGDDFLSDIVALPFTIPKGAAFALRPYFQCTAGVLYNQFASTTQMTGSGDAAQYAASGVSDLTLGGTITNTLASLRIAYFPIGVYTYTSVESYACIGDSRCAGDQDYSYSRTGGVGELERTLGQNYPTINLGVGGDQINTALGRYTKRAAAAAYCTRIADEYGTNDITGARTAAQLLADKASMATLLGGKPYYVTTLSPRRTDAAGATPATGEAERVIYNDTVRRIPAPFAGCWDVADVMESGRNTGLWRTDVERTVTDAVTVVGALITSATANFTTADIGKAIAIAGAGAAGAVFYGVIYRLNGGGVNCLTNPATIVAAGNMRIGLVQVDGVHESPYGYSLIAASGVIR